MQDIEQVLGIGTVQDSEANSSKVDVTIIIGKDYK